MTKLFGRGLTQREVAESLGVSATVISRAVGGVAGTRNRKDLGMSTTEMVREGLEKMVSGLE